MIKKISCLIAAVLLCLAFMVPSFALGEEIMPRLVDGADILTDSEEAELLQNLDTVSEKHSFDVVIVTVETLNGSGMTIAEFADDLYDYNNFGFGDKGDGILLLVDMDGREWFISTSGYGMTAFNDDGWQYIGKQIEPILGDGNYYRAFETFIVLCDDFLVQAENGEAYTNSTLPREKLSLMWIPGSILIGMGISFLIMLGFRSQLKTVRRKSAAQDYQVPDSMHITHQSEMFLYQHVSRTPKQTQSSSKGGGVRVGSSGRSHGGGGGRF